MNAITHKIGLSTAFSLLMFLSGNNALAAPVSISDIPLFVTSSVEPNIFFTLDDSGSMDWEVSIPDTASFTTYNGAPTHQWGYWQPYLHPGWSNYKYYSTKSYNNNDYNIIPPASYTNSSNNATIKSYWVMFNHNFNTLYYNPLTEYKPWKGLDSTTGLPLYEAALPTLVSRDPNDTDHSGDTVDLTQNYDYFDSVSTWGLQTGVTYLPSYYDWTDDNNDGVLQAGETHTYVAINAATATYSHRDINGNVVLTRTGTDELKNFANWFEYYRKREFATKATIGGIISSASGSRMGLRLINDGHKMNLRTMSDSTNKEDLLKTFYGIDSVSSTPLRLALRDTGDMYKAKTYNGESVMASNGGECQQNFTLLMTDGYWNGGSPSVGNTDKSLDTDGFDGDQSESNDGGNYEDENSDTLADVAMEYYENDLRPLDLDNRVPTTEGVDENNKQHMVTYTISFGVKGTLDIDTYNPLASGFTWPNPFSATDSELHRIDDLIHAAYNGRGLYLSAQNPVDLEASLTAALADIEERKATQSAASVTSSRLTTDSIVFVSQFNTNRWQGNMFAFPIVENDGVFSLDIPANPMDAVNAAAALSLQAKDGGHLTRTIFTKNGSTGVPFKWGNISDEMKADLRINEGGTTGSDETAQARLNYLRGDTSHEGSGFQFRTRATITPQPLNPLNIVTNVLGDIVHSGPVYVAKPSLNWPDEAPFPTDSNDYSTFKESKASRPGMIYLGANDGMIHGFSETGLAEKVAYVPSNLVSTETDRGLHFLTHSNYQHRYYNDLTPTVSDIYINGDWHTIGIFGQRAGGRGYSALDITDPVFSDPTETVMWEFSSSDDADLGYTFSTPQVGLANDGEWVAVFGNGYNNDGSGKAALFIVKIRAGLDGTWDATDYKKIYTGSSTTTPNGLATPALADINGDGTIDRVYAGDLDGQMWAFDLSGDSPTDWGLAHGSTPLFQTIGQRPITTQPSLSFHPSVTTDSTNAPNIMVAFGSGQYMSDADKNSNSVNHFYGVWDKGDDSAGLNSGDLVEQTFTSSSPRILTTNDVDYSSPSHKYGWYIELDITNERSITDSFIRSGYAFFNTAIPSSDACSSSSYGYRFVVNLDNGGTPSKPVIDSNRDGLVDSNDKTAAAEIIGDPDDPDNGGSPPPDATTEGHILNGEDIIAIQDAPTRKTGRISWQELLQ